MRRALVRAIGTSAMAGAMLFAGASLASADPAAEPPPPAPAPGCTAADLAQASGTVGTAMGVYLFSHPDVNDYWMCDEGRLTYHDLREQRLAELGAAQEVDVVAGTEVDV